MAFMSVQMDRIVRHAFIGVVFVLLPIIVARGITNSQLGIFEGNGDVGSVLHPGSVSFAAANDQYTVAGSGENMWFNNDAFYFVWKKTSGDMTISADIAFLGQGSNPHRKAVLMIRQSLQPDSVYADIALHGVGLTSLQYRPATGANTEEVQAKISAPPSLQLEKHGDEFSMLLGDGNGKLERAGGPIRVPIRGEYYIGIGVCSHDANIVEKAVFSNVNIRPSSPVAKADWRLQSNRHARIA
jgi:TolB protein